MIRFDHGERTFIIVRDHEDNYYCSDGLCTHEEVHLSDGLVIEATIECICLRLLTKYETAIHHSHFGK
ncbi:Rieske 2Fe-2S domain-containing protein [Octadecabacter sp.]|nr:Rieske 2Fe-2S domain-containing protein [Octadecabacter sp.]MDC1379889.1 Rieske 2Fe-2S domain-containing protein [Octadecabacter sp.]